MISRGAISSGLEAISLGGLLAESIAAPRTPARNIVEHDVWRWWATKDGEKEQGGTIPPRWGSSHRSKMVNAVVLRPPRGNTPGNK